VRGPQNPTRKIINVHAPPRTVSKIELPSTPAASTNVCGVISTAPLFFRSLHGNAVSFRRSRDGERLYINDDEKVKGRCFGRD
jgi:hypothetical protein